MLESQEGHIILKFRGREAPEGWYLFFEDLQWGPFACREDTERLANEMIATLSKEFKMPVNERRVEERPDKELMPWVKRKQIRGHDDTERTPRQAGRD